MKRVELSEINKRRLLISGAVLALVAPVLTLVSLASNPSGITTPAGTSSAFQCSDIAKLETAKGKNCNAYETAKAGKVSFDKKLEETKAAYEARAQQGCAGLSEQALVQCNQELANLKQAYDAAGTTATKALLEVTRTKNVCDSSTAILNDLKNRCATTNQTPARNPEQNQTPATTPEQTQTHGQNTATDNDLQVCDLDTKRVIAIKESEYNTAKHSKNLNLCLTISTTPAVQEIRVCDLVHKRVITIKEADFDAAKHSKNIGLCVSAANELPQTGPAEMLVSLVAITVLTAAAGYLISSRQSKAMRNDEMK